MPQYILQEHNEKRFNRKHIDKRIREEIKANPVMQDKVEQGVQLVQDYIDGEYYASKMKRVSQLKNMALEPLVTDIFVGIAYCQIPELFTSVTASMASRLRFSDKTEAIMTVAELVAVLCETDAFDITKENARASLMVQSLIPLSSELEDFVRNSSYLPPMVCEPLKLTSNFSSGYLTHNDSLVLGNGNHHDGDLCLDVLNTINRVQLKLDTDFLCKVEEEPTYEFETKKQHDQWLEFKKQSYRMYMRMVDDGNKFYFCHKVDKRGRIYASGYHLNPMGSAFKKACIELFNEELVEGVPNQGN